MVLEIAEIEIPPGREAEFDDAIRHGIATVLSRSPGFQGATVHRGHESPQRCILQVRWARLEDHVPGFRESALFPQWRAIVGPFFAQPPRVEHYHAVCSIESAPAP